MKLLGSFLAILATFTVPGHAQAAPYRAILAGSASRNYPDVRAVARPDLTDLSNRAVNANPVSVRRTTSAFMRLWDGTSTLADLIVAPVSTHAKAPSGSASSAPPLTVTLLSQDASGRPAAHALVLGSAQAVSWTLFAENGAFSAESFSFSYGTRQVVATAVKNTE